MLSRIAIALAALMISACASTPEQLATRDDISICRSYGVYSRSGLWSAAAESHKAEMIRRNLLSPEEWRLAEQRKLRIGMSQCALYASWGGPDRENRSVGRFGTHIQHVYNAGLRYIRPTYVYTQNGKVTSWQD